MQEKKTKPENAAFSRLRYFQVSEDLTWNELAIRLGISVSMIMMVKRGERNLSKKALYRLDQAEREIAKRKSRAEGIVDQILRDEGNAAELIGRAARKSGTLDLAVEYLNQPANKLLPRQITLSCPPEQGCSKLRQLFAETIDTKVVLMSCLPDAFRSEKYLAKLSADSRTRLTNGALSLVVPDWRDIVAKSVVKPV